MKSVSYGAMLAFEKETFLDADATSKFVDGTERERERARERERERESDTHTHTHIHTDTYTHTPRRDIAGCIYT